MSGEETFQQQYTCMDSLRSTEQVEYSRLLGRTQSTGTESHGISHASVAAPAMAPRQSGVELSTGSMSARSLQHLDDADGGDEGEPDVDLFAQVDSLVKPVSATMLMVVGLVGVLSSSPVSGTFSNMMVYEEKEDDSTSTKLAGSVENALIFIALIVGVTTLLFLLYKFHCTKLIYAWLITSVGMLLASFGGLVAYMLVLHMDLAIDQVSATLLLWNFAVVGVRVVFWPAPAIVKQAYLVIVSVLLAWSLTKLPEWTTWSILAAVSLWDLVAVLSPAGPLKGLVEESQRRNEPIPGLVYEADDIKLGLGDFVFYSVLIGRAMMHDVTTVVTCFIAILMGLGMTLLLLALHQKALPALPISIALGMAFYFLTSMLVTPMVVMLNSLDAFV